MSQDDSKKTPPTSEPAPERPSAPSSESAPAPAAAPTSRFAAWWSAPATVLTVLFVIAVLMALTATFGVLAFRRDQASQVSRQTVATLSPTLTRPPARPTGGAPTPPLRPEAEPPVDPNVLGITYTSGSLRANDGAYIDFDDDEVTGRRTDESDVAVDAFGVTGLAAVPLSVFGRDADPTRHDCASIPPQEWEVTVPTEQLDEGARVCFRTDEQRYGFFVVMGRRLTDSGGLIGLDLSYQVWEGPQDREDHEE